MRVVSWRALLERVRRRFRPPRRAVPTRAGWFVLAVPLVLGMAAVTASNNLLFMLLAASLGAIVLSGILSERNIREVRVHVRPVTAAYAGEPCRLEVRFERPPELGPAFGLKVLELEHSGLWSPRRKAPPTPCRPSCRCWRALRQPRLRPVSSRAGAGPPSRSSSW